MVIEADGEAYPQATRPLRRLNLNMLYGLDAILRARTLTEAGRMVSLSQPAMSMGGSTGTNLWACAMLAREMATAGQTGSIVTLLCDSGERYGCTYYDQHWLEKRGVAWQPAAAAMDEFLGGSSCG